MKLATRSQDGANILEVQGDIDLYNSPEIRKALLEALRDKNAKRVVVNLTGDNGDGRDGDSSAKAHHESGADAGPENALRQCEHQHQDRAGTRPQAHGDDGREAALPPVAAFKLLRLRRMGMAPGRGLVAMVVMAMMAVVMSMAVIAVRMIAMRMVMVMVMVMTVRLVRPLRPQQFQQRPALHPHQPQADQCDRRVTDDLDDADRLPHRPRRGAEQHRGDADEQHRGHRLEHRGRKRQ